MRPGFGLDSMAELRDERTRVVTAENPDGAVGAGGRAESDLGVGRKGRPCITIPAGETVELLDMDGPGAIRHVWITVTPRTDAGEYVFRDLTLRAYWDGEENPSVEVPLGDFFCCGHGQRARVESLPVVAAPNGGLNTYLPMPFREHARVTVESDHPVDVAGFFYQFDCSLDTDVDDDTGYLHAQFRRSNPVTPGEDHTILEAEGRGHLAGTYLGWTALGDHWWGEGEVKCYVDGDDEFPTICGTGTEDYVGGAWCFGDDETYSTPFLGYPTCDPDGGADKHGLYRFHVPDPVRFEADLRVTVQDIGHDGHGLFERADDVASVAYWYQDEPHGPFPDYPDRRGRRPR